MTDPRLLLIDFTPISGTAATSTLKAAYFRDWPEDALLQITHMGHERLGAAAGAGRPRTIFTQEPNIQRLIETFRPQAILYRPVSDSHALHEYAMAAIDAGLAAGAGLALWIMDDWPARLEKADPERFRSYDKDLRTLFSKSRVNFAISEGMADAFATRYGVSFKVAHNGIDPEAWPSPARTRRRRVVIRYAGSLAPDMAKESVTRVAQAVSALARQGVAVRFEGRTQDHWMNEGGAALNDLNAVSFRSSGLGAARYRRWLSEADILLIAYNFDEATRTYVKYSFANKTPEIMAAGAAVLAYGPEEIETMACLRRSGAALMVTQDDDAALGNAIDSLVRDRVRREALGAAARRFAFDVFDLERMKARFRKELVDIARASLATPADLGAKRAVREIAAPSSFYRRFADAAHDRAPILFSALQPMARGLRSARSRLRS